MPAEPGTAEIKQLFENWLRASSSKNIDGAMAPIAPGVLSYEHGMPLVYRGVDAIRPVCEAGFAMQRGEFDWSIPDLQILVRGDLAVTWGLNRMRSKEPGEPEWIMWSRGTRVFQKIDDEWKLIHQHVSFPFDPGTGQARFDLEPE